MASQDSLMMEKIHEAKIIELVDFEELSKQIEKLTLEQKAEIARRLLKDKPGGIIIIGDNNMITNSNVIQLGGTAEEISKQINDLPPEEFAELVRAVALTMKNNNQEQQ